MLFAYFAVMMTVLGGCTQTGQQQSDVLLSQNDQAQALENEAEQKYIGAYRYWQDALKIVQDKLASLDVSMKEISTSYSDMGVVLYQKKDEERAIKAFLQALKYDATNETALTYMTKRFRPGEKISYTVKDSDSYGDIATAVYGTPEDAYLVKIFGGKGAQDLPAAGTELQLPKIESFFSQALLDYKRDLLHARELYREKKFQELLPLAEKLKESSGDQEESSFLYNSTLVALGRTMEEEHSYDKALEYFRGVDPRFRDMKADISRLEERRSEKDALEGDRQNQQLLQEARRLYAGRHYLEAQELLVQVDPSYAGVARLQDAVAVALKREAEMHYKKGVTFFIDDKLKEAIDEWNLTLRYDPDHPKAAGNIFDARKLLEKVNALEK